MYGDEARFPDSPLSELLLSFVFYVCSQLKFYGWPF